MGVVENYAVVIDMVLCYNATKLYFYPTNMSLHTMEPLEEEHKDLENPQNHDQAERTSEERDSMGEAIEKLQDSLGNMERLQSRSNDLSLVYHQGLQQLLSQFAVSKVFEDTQALRKRNAKGRLHTYQLIKTMLSDKKERKGLYEMMKHDSEKIQDSLDKGNLDRSADLNPHDLKWNAETYENLDGIDLREAIDALPLSEMGFDRLADLDEGEFKEIQGVLSAHHADLWKSSLAYEKESHAVRKQLVENALALKDKISEQRKQIEEKIIREYQEFIAPHLKDIAALNEVSLETAMIIKQKQTMLSKVEKQMSKAKEKIQGRYQDDLKRLEDNEKHVANVLRRLGHHVT